MEVRKPENGMGGLHKEVWEEWEENGEQQQRTEELKTVDREHRESKVRKE